MAKEFSFVQPSLDSVGFFIPPPLPYYMAAVPVLVDLGNSEQMIDQLPMYAPPSFVTHHMPDVPSYEALKFFHDDEVDNESTIATENEYPLNEVMGPRFDIESAL